MHTYSEVTIKVDISKDELIQNSGIDERIVQAKHTVIRNNIKIQNILKKPQKNDVQR